MKDFRQATTPAAAPRLDDRQERARRIIRLSLYGSALLFGLAGIWLLFSPPVMFTGDEGRYLGLGFVITAALDVLFLPILTRTWRKQDGR